jgi:biotin carboxyl carrier protein
MKRYRITLEGHTYDVQVLDDPRRDQVRVRVDGETFTVGVETMSVAAEVSAREAAPAVAPAPATPMPVVEDAAVAGNVVSAPLPGVIKSIAVRSNQQVARDDELLVIEAMKMDNVIRAPREGTIGTIHVTEGRQVSYGEPLLELDHGRN